MRYAFSLAMGLLIDAAVAGTAIPPAAPSILTAPRTFIFSYETAVTPPEGAQKVRLWIPLPASDSHQTIQNLTITASVPHLTSQEPEYGNTMAYLEASAPFAGPLTVAMSFTATRTENTGGANGGNASRERLLKGDTLAPLDTPELQTIRNKAIGPASAPGEVARKAYDAVLDHMTYDKSGTGWGKGDLRHACAVGKGNCTDFHALFIGLLRASKVPARFEVGFSLPPERGGSEIKGYHCWALYQDPAQGWIPVDASEADKDPAMAEYYFGRHSTNRIKFTMGRDVSLSPRQDGPPLNYFIYPYAEADGKPLDQGVMRKFSFKDLP